MKTDAQTAGISIHALLAESDNGHAATAGDIDISIHALLAESDAGKTATDRTVPISIHALLAESDDKLASCKTIV